MAIIDPVKQILQDDYIARKEKLMCISTPTHRDSIIEKLFLETSVEDAFNRSHQSFIDKVNEQ